MRYQYERKVQKIMKDSSVFKIKDSIDLFLSNESYIMAYYMNTRQKKGFRVNQTMVKLLEQIDGKKTLSDLYGFFGDISENEIKEVITVLQKNKIVTEVQDMLEILNKEDSRRYNRQLNYFSEFFEYEQKSYFAQKRVINAKVLIFGCGAIGGNIALQLAMAGVKRFILFDYDNVEESDIARHLFFSREYIGQKKTMALTEELRKISAGVEVEKVDSSMKPDSSVEAIIQRADFVVNTLDEPYIGYTSSKISRICVKYRLPHYIAGGFDAHLASTGELVIPYTTPCVECYASYFKEALKGWKPKKHPVPERSREIGGLACLSLFSSSYACIEIIKCLAELIPMREDYKVRGEFLFTDMSLTYLNVDKNESCPVCGGKYFEEP